MSFRHRTSIFLDEFDIERLNVASLVLRRVGKMHRMPTISETVSWMLRTSPIDDLWESIKDGTYTGDESGLESESEPDVSPPPAAPDPKAGRRVQKVRSKIKA